MKKLMFTLLMCASLGFVGCGNGPSNPDNGGDGGGQTCDPACKDTEVCKDGQCKSKEQTGDPTVCDPECKDTEKCENGTCVDDTTTSGPDVKLCGNGKIDDGETCDPGSTNAARTCIPEAECTAKSKGCDTYTYSVGTEGNQCTSQCKLTKITEAVPGDGCCPDGKTLAEDSDCVPYQLCKTKDDCKGSKYGETCYNNPNFGKEGYCVDFVSYNPKHECSDEYLHASGGSPPSMISTCLFRCTSDADCPGDTQCDGTSAKPGACQPYVPPVEVFPNAGIDCTQNSDCTAGVMPEEFAKNVLCLPFKANTTSEMETNQGGFCLMAGCGDDFKCPTGFGCYRQDLGQGKTVNLCFKDCDPQNPAACEDTAGNICRRAGGGKGACAFGPGVCKADTDCVDQTNYTCVARGISDKKHCYLKATGTKAKGDACTISSECPADTYCESKDLLKSVYGDQTVAENNAMFCTSDCATDADCAGIPDTHCMDFLGNGRGYCTAVTTCTSDTECSTISAQLTCQDATLHGGGTVKMCMPKA